MRKTDFLSADKISFAAGAALLAALTGCVAEPSTQRTAYRGRPAVQVQSAISYQDDYDYFPGYEVYYSRHRREYVYRDGNAWVRRPEPPGRHGVRAVCLRVGKNGVSGFAGAAP